ncbi:hypothetical protein GUJ93_ZPchr0001g30798 [Zizania palustris]|uniref:Uncharacterized protein n=1 Tax=Zizania palustris TaxID=103762 RepID=A0A8J5VS33_ZIZPA|nr:hypothetical protein GUJ93_ZPchr0001g30798 [Zizania palustris]
MDIQLSSDRTKKRKGALLRLGFTTRAGSGGGSEDRRWGRGVVEEAALGEVGGGSGHRQRGGRPAVGRRTGELVIGREGLGMEEQGARLA